MFEKILPLGVTNRQPGPVVDEAKSTSKALEPTKKAILKIFKVKSLGLGYEQGVSSFLRDKRRAQFEEPPYDFDRIIQAIDTDSYVKQAFLKYRELCWKEGWEIVGENPEAVEYLWQRIDYFEVIMGRSFGDFLADVVDQLVKFHNAFIVIARGNIRPFFPGSLYTKDGVDPVAGFYLIPTEKALILRDKNNNPLAYRQALEDIGHTGNIDEPEWDANEVIHMFFDRKPGRAFGTPFVTAVLDDVISLRQMEEDFLNLSHKELFPLYKYKIGTEERPASPEEINDAVLELENLRTEGGLILPERHDVEVIGSEGSSLSIEPYLDHMRNRVARGLGMFPHILGFGNNNRSVTDRLDISLYEKVKMYQRYVENIVRLRIFNMLLIEGGFNPFTTPADQQTKSDRCIMRFREIDKDTQVKVEAAWVDQFNKNGITWPELRLRLGLDPNEDMEQLFMNMQHKLDMEQTAEQLKLSASLQPATETVSKSPTGGTSKKVTKPVKPDAVMPSTGGKANKPNDKGLSNLIRPANQHGRRLSPNIRHSADDDLFINEWLDDIIDLLDDEQG